jgi:cation:H+ antiporter
VSAAFFLGGLLLLSVGAEAFVRGASRLAAAMKISPLVVGLTVVAFGTSSPELAVGVKASLAGQTSLLVGNVVGSNIFNVLFILGLSALVAPLAVSRQLVRLDVPLMVLLSLLVLIFAGDGKIGRGEGLSLLLALGAYTVFLIRASRRELVPEADAFAREYADATGSWRKRWLLHVLLLAGGLAALVLGSKWLVQSAVAIARALGVSELIIGLTVIAAGTSLPEVVTSIVATLRGERDIAVGNAVGSNLFNLLGVLGVCGVLAPSGIEVPPAALRFDLPIMLAVAFACLPIFFTGLVIARWEGGLFLGYYAAYTLYLILSATRHDALPLYSATMLYFVVPLTALTLLVLTGRAIRRR